MTRSAGKSAHQGKPHIGSSETWEAGCWFAVPFAVAFPNPQIRAYPGTEFCRKIRSPKSSYDCFSKVRYVKYEFCRMLPRHGSIDANYGFLVYNQTVDQVTHDVTYEARPVFKSSIRRNGPRPWEIWTFRGHFEVRPSNGSGIWDPQFEFLRIELMKTDWP